MTLSLVPLRVKAALPFCDEHHSHLDPSRGGLFAVGERLVCVAVAGRPARKLQELGHVDDVTRVASDGTAEHAASMALGAIRRAALALGYRRLVSYTLLGEAGTSYRAAGWWPTSLGKGGTWSRAGRPRAFPIQPGLKVRWETGPLAEPIDQELAALVRESVGKIALPPRPRREVSMPLFDRAGGSP